MKSKFLQIKISIFLFLFIPIYLNGQNNILDPTFGNNGVAYHNLFEPPINEIPFDMQLQPDGKIILSGSLTGLLNPYTFLSRLNVDGSPDLSFGNAGNIFTHFSNVPQLPIAGSVTNVLIRLQSNGEIIQAINYKMNYQHEFILIRYAATGAIDTTFGNNGAVALSISNLNNYMYQFQQIGGIVINNSGHILISGTAVTKVNAFDPDSTGYKKCFVTQLQPDGGIDTTFGSAGLAFVDFRDTTIQNSTNKGMILQSTGKIVIGAQTFWNDGIYGHKGWGLARLNAGGTLDSTFANDGKISGSDLSIIKEIIEQADEKIIIYDENRLKRFLPDGSIDPLFGSNSMVDISANIDFILFDADIQPSGKILMTGSGANITHTDFRSTRINEDGSIDHSFGTNGMVLSNLDDYFNFSNLISVQPDGKFIVGGVAPYWELALIRYIEDPFIGIEMPYQENCVKIYPNPTSGNIYISMDNAPPDRSMEISVINIEGKIIQVNTINGLDLRNKYLMQFNANPGIYFIKVDTGTEIIYRKIVKL